MTKQIFRNSVIVSFVKIKVASILISLDVADLEATAKLTRWQKDYRAGFEEVDMRLIHRVKILGDEAVTKIGHFVSVMDYHELICTWDGGMVT